MPPSTAVFPSSELGFLLEDYGQPGGVLGAEPADHLSAFSGDLSRFLRYLKLKVGKHSLFLDVMTEGPVL